MTYGGVRLASKQLLGKAGSSAQDAHALCEHICKRGVVAVSCESSSILNTSCALLQQHRHRGTQVRGPHLAVQPGQSRWHLVIDVLKQWRQHLMYIYA